MTADQPRHRTPALPAPALAGWRYRAACRGTDLNVFFPGRGESAEPARQICATCPVRQPCLEFALSHGITHGIWGGLTERDRRPLRVHHTADARRQRDEAITAAAAKAAAGHRPQLPVRRARRQETMTTDPPADPSPRALGESLSALAAQVADLRGQIRAVNERLDQAGLRSGLNLAARFEDLAQTVAGALHAAAPRGSAAPSWIGLDRDTYRAQLADLRQWADTVLRPHYGGYELRECWPRHIHAVWELSTLAAEWHRTYAAPRPDLARALEFYDRWLPGTMRRITDITRGCMPQCATLRNPGDWTARPRYR